MINRVHGKVAPKYLTLVTTIFLIAVFMSVPQSAMAEVINGESDVSTKILKNWSCAYSGKQLDIQLSFRLTKSGDVYDIELIKGFGNPSAIRSAIHAVVFAMPFDVQEGNTKIFTCTITGDSDKPEVGVSISEAEPIPLNTTDDPNAEFYSHTAASRIARLCSRLYEVPDSAEAFEDVRILCQSKAVDCNDSQVWLILGRLLSPVIVIQRNPPPSTDVQCRAAATAYLRACQLKRTKQNLYALEEGYTQLVALQVLKASKADPLVLASAAVLTYQFKMAQDQYNQAMKEGSPSARAMFNQLVVQKGAINYTRLASYPSNWEKLLYWLPEDAELLAVGKPNTTKVKSSNSFPFFMPVVSENASVFRKFPERVLETNKLFLDSKVAVALHSSRSFPGPKGLRVGCSDSADILVFKDESRSLSKLVMERIRTQQVATLQYEGTEIMVFEREPFTFARFCLGANNQIAQFVCSPAEGILISSSRIDFMRDVLIRMRDPSASRSFPSSMPEWKLVDTAAEVWGIRHHRHGSSGNNVGALFVSEAVGKSAKQSEIPREDVGMCFAVDSNKLKIRVLSDSDEYLKIMERQWRIDFNNDGMHPVKDDSAPGKTRSTISDHVMTIEGPIEKRNMALLMLFNSLGYFISL